MDVRTRRLVVLLAACAVVLSALAASHPLGALSTTGQPHLPKMPRATATADHSPTAQPPAVPTPWLPPDVAPANPWVTRVLGGLLLLVLLAAVFWLVRRIVRDVVLDREVESEAEARVAQGPIDLVGMADELERAHEQVTSADDFSGAITEAWRRLEDLAAESGAERQPWQSTSEYCVDVLQHTPAERTDLVELAEVYRRSVYASSAPTTDDRERALACLRRLRSSLGTS